MRKVNTNVLSAVNTSSHNGVVIDSNQLLYASFQSVSGDTTLGGTITIQASNDICLDQYQPATFTPTNWTAIPNATATITSGASTLITINQCSYRWMRVVFTYTSGGSSTINVNLFALSV